MKKIFITFLLGSCITLIMNAQEYKTGIGLRAGFSSGLTIKHFNSKHAALEGLLTTRWQGWDVTGLYEVHNRAFDTNHLNWYIGGGAHLGVYNGSNAYWGRYGQNYTVIGIDGVVGIEYTFNEIPLNLGIDWKPALNLIGYYGFWSEGAISIRYVF